ncbi:carboxypeptidase-like regulatory domain-containing protein [Hymenobacter ruricola]|uniref:Carboxypeptidase regulatory-like domain-containing protein n=1 Tax=Hymenobacter ruricola TaxID=2791023 RepID=A0ABS0HZU9_9BACT|nr:carboxypeptidase-like regulatory domain-containing protein [Hymenobacter ruricola]MBF9219824.1 carboxypeptidase regulatory-like domain-containing protein [Hymenobacter ruricola]
MLRSFLSARRRPPLVAWAWLLTLLLSGALAGCHHEDGIDPVPSPENPTQVTTAVSGLVRDEQNRPVAGALVRVAGQSQTTDANGAFCFASVTVPAARYVVQASKANYFDSTVGLKPGAGQTATTVLLTSRGPALTLGSATAGGTLQVPGGARIEFPAGAVARNGSAYGGAVQAYVRYIDPTSARVNDLMPGRDLQAESADGKTQKLKTFGAMRVELEDGAGQALQLAAGQRATLRFPVPASMRGAAPATIPLWHFDEAKGLWVEEGSASLTGGEYVGTVGHFSSWNADQIVGPSAFIKFRIRPTTDLPGFTKKEAPYPVARVSIPRLGLQMTVLCNSADSVQIVEVPSGSWTGPAGEADELFSTAAENFGTASVNRLRLGNLAPGTTTDIGTLRVNPLSAVKGRFAPNSCNGRPVDHYFAYYDTPTANGDFTLFYRSVSADGQFNFRCAPGQLIRLAFYNDGGQVIGQRDVAPPPAGQVLDLGALDPCTGNPATNPGNNGGILVPGNPGSGSHTVDPSARVDFTINGDGHVNESVQMRDTSPAGAGPFATFFANGAAIGIPGPALQLQAGGTGPGSKFIYLALENASGRGTFPLTVMLPGLMFNGGELTMQAYFPQSPRPATGLTVTITRYDAVGGRIQGTFAGTLMALSGDVVTISNGSFDLRRGVDL